MTYTWKQLVEKAIPSVDVKSSFVLDQLLKERHYAIFMKSKQKDFGLRDVEKVVEVDRSDSFRPVKVSDAWLNLNSYGTDWVIVYKHLFTPPDPNFPVKESLRVMIKSLEEGNPQKANTHLTTALMFNVSGCKEAEDRLTQAKSLLNSNLIEAAHTAATKAYKALNNTLEEKEMTTITRRVIQIDLIDNDAGLDVQHSLVASYPNIITEDDDATTIQELIMNQAVGKKLKAHNEIRCSQVDLDVLKRTGNTVNLLPVKLKDLTWVVK